MSDFDSHDRSLDDASPRGDWRATGTARRGLNGAGLVWVIAGIEVLLWGFCGVLAAAGTLLPADAFQGQLPPGQHLNVAQVKNMFAVAAATIGVLIVLPGVALAVLGFGVRDGKAGPRKAAVVILIVQAGLLALLTVMNLTAAASQGNVGAGVVNLVFMGGMVVLLAWGARTLAAGGNVKSASRAADAADSAEAEDGLEPWNQHLRQ